MALSCVSPFIHYPGGGNKCKHENPNPYITIAGQIAPGDGVFEFFIVLICRICAKIL